MLTAAALARHNLVCNKTCSTFFRTPTASSEMSKAKGRCVFCGNTGNLTKSHVWPEWAEAFLPQTATHREQIIGEFATFIPKAKGPALWKKIRPGHVGTRKPRNTCLKCNSGWMRLIEEATMEIVPPLLLGNQRLLWPTEQRLLAAFLCLVSMRVAFSSRDMRAIPAVDHDWLRNHSEPPAHWKIWIAGYAGTPRMGERYTAMQIASSPDVPSGVEHCNSQVTTLVIGKLCAHLFSSTVWRDFVGYEGVDLVRIWPPANVPIEVTNLPIIIEAEVPWLHEAVARETTNIPAR
jgi:hypothetical protein